MKGAFRVPFSVLHKLDMMIQDCNPGTLGMEAGGSKAQDHLQLHGNSGSSLDFVKLYPEKKEVEEGVVLYSSNEVRGDHADSLLCL